MSSSVIRRCDGDQESCRDLYVTQHEDLSPDVSLQALDASAPGLSQEVVIALGVSCSVIAVLIVLSCAYAIWRFRRRQKTQEAAAILQNNHRISFSLPHISTTDPMPLTTYPEETAGASVDTGETRYPTVDRPAPARSLSVISLIATSDTETDTTTVMSETDPPPGIAARRNRRTSLRKARVNVNVSADEASRRRMSLPAALMTRRRSSLSNFAIFKEELDLQGYDDQGDVQGDSDKDSVGRFCFKLGYNPQTERLSLVIVMAQGLDLRSESSEVDVFIKISLEPAPKQRQVTRYARGTNPVFNERLQFNCPAAQLMEKYLHFAVKEQERSRSGRRKLLGRAQVALRDCVGLSAAFSSKTDELWRHLVSEAETGSFSGSVLVTLTRDAVGEKLLMSVDRGREFCTDNNNADAPGSVAYVRASLQVDGRLVKERRTKPVPLSPCPEWDKEFSFSLASSKFHNACLVLVLCCKAADGRKRVLGRTVIGPYTLASGVGHQQWRNAMAVTGKPTSEWLYLEQSS